MRVSVFTPTHNPRFLDECYRSLASQTLSDWEWAVVPYGKLSSWQPPEPDPRVRVARTAGKLKGVGAAKRAACEFAGGDILVELDHDDLLTPTCLAEIRAAFEREDAIGLVYSDWAHINEDGSPNRSEFNVESGWRYSSVSIEGTDYTRRHAMASTPHNVGYSWYAPSHVRAFRRSAYEAVGGFNADRLTLAEQDLVLRLFTHSAFHHIDECLYLHRTYSRDLVADPQTPAGDEPQAVTAYLENIEELALTWTQRAGLRSISLTTPTSFENPAIDARFDTVELDPAVPELPFEDGTVGVIKAIDVLQRLTDRGAFLNECHRVLAHAGELLTDTPSTDGRGAFQDPSAVSFYNENSFMYLTQAVLRRTIPALATRWQVSNLQTYFPSETHESMDIPYVKANLMAIKEGSRQGGPLLA